MHSSFIGRYNGFPGAIWVLSGKAFSIPRSSPGLSWHKGESPLLSLCFTALKLPSLSVFSFWILVSFLAQSIVSLGWTADGNISVGKKDWQPLGISRSLPRLLSYPANQISRWSHCSTHPEAFSEAGGQNQHSPGCHSKSVSLARFLSTAVSRHGRCLILWTSASGLICTFVVSPTPHPPPLPMRDPILASGLSSGVTALRSPALASEGHKPKLIPWSPGFTSLKVVLRHTVELCRNATCFLAAAMVSYFPVLALDGHTWRNNKRKTQGRKRGF